MDNLQTFLTAIKDSIAETGFAKLTLSKPRDKKLDYRNVFVKLVEIKKGIQLSFVYRHATNDVTKNHSIKDGMQLIHQMVADVFVHADLFTSNGEWHLTTDKRGKVSLKRKAIQREVSKDLSHDHAKKRLIQFDGNIYLRELGILTADWKIKAGGEDKFRQIDKFVEVVGGIIRKQGMQDSCNIVDMGSGKGYLTFALYDYLVNTLKLSPKVVGIELRPQLVETCNEIAKRAAFKGLHFSAGTIENAELAELDVLIALHACDTATDDAIFRGIQAESKIIICAPCCHKQLRKQIKPRNDLQKITRFGILEERQAEILTDGIRALILEAHGYVTKVFEFISTEHTPKNVMIVAIKDETAPAQVSQKRLDQIANIKQLYNIEYHHLERLLGLL
jgi:SAM-dependent methyltransferase